MTESRVFCRHAIIQREMILPGLLIISTGMKIYGEESGSSKMEGRIKQIVQEISDRLRTGFQEQGWIQ